MFACIHVRFLQIEILRQQIFEFSQSFSRHYGVGMVEIDDLLEKGQASSKVDEVVKVGVVFAQGEVVDDEFSAG